MFRKICLGLVLAGATTANAQSLAVEKYRLPNGMTVILHEDHSQPIVAVNIWYKVGSKDEADRRSGFAHLFEHLMFMGTQRVGNGRFDTLMEEHGGSNNATTTEDRTNYFESGPSSLLPLLLWLEADRLESLAEAMDQKKLDLQREVVKNERREGVENAPHGKAYEAIPGLMFPRFHPYSTSVIGSMEDLDNASVRDVKEFFGTFYVPNNASLVIAGDFDSKATKSLVAKLFGTLPRGNDIVRKPVPLLTLNGVKRTTMVDKVQAGKSIMMWHSPAAFKPGDVEMRLAGGILAGSFTSRLYQSLVVDQPIASEVSAYQNPLLLGSTFTIDATARQGVSLDRLEKAIDAVLLKFKKEGPSNAELERQFAQVDYQAFNELQSLQQRADRLNEFEFYFGEPNSFAKERALYHRVTPASLKAVVDKTLDMNRRLIVRVIPEAEAPEQNPRDQQPKVEKPKPFAFPLPAEFTLTNGMRVFYWRKPELPLTTVALRFGRGASLDPASKSGQSELLADMLDESAGSRNADQFSNALDQLGAQLGTGADQRGLTVQLSTLTDKLQPALELMADAVIRPRFEQTDWTRIKQLHLENLANENDDPSTLATKVSNREFFGATHAYSRPVAGTVATITQLSLGDIQSIYARLNPSAGTFYASGNLTQQEFRRLLEVRFGKWLKKADAAGTTPLPNIASDKQRVLIVDRPDAVQTVIRVMMPTEPFSAPQRHALTALGVAFGGTFTSRLNRNLREDKGYTYGAGLSFVFTRPISYVVASTSVRADVTGAALKEISAEFTKVQSGDLTPEEAAKAVNTIRVDFVNALGTRQGLVSTAIAYRENGIPFTQIGAELEQFANLDASALNTVAKNGLAFGRALIVLVGDRSTIEKQIAGLGLATPEIVKG